MVAIASPSVLVCSVTAVTSSNRVTSRLIVRPSVADSGSLLLCPQLHRARRDGCCTRDAAIADPRRLIEHGGQLVKKEELLRAGWADKGIAVRIGVIRIRRVERVIRIEGEAKGEEGVESVTMGEKEAVVPEVVGRSRGMPELSAEPKVAGSRVPEAEPKGPRGQRAVIKEPVAPLEQLPPEGSGAGGLGHPLRADRQLAPAEVALDLRPEPPAGCRGLRRQTEQAEGHQSEQESLHF